MRNAIRTFWLTHYALSQRGMIVRALTLLAVTRKPAPEIAGAASAAGIPPETPKNWRYVSPNGLGFALVAAGTALWLFLSVATIGFAFCAIRIGQSLTAIGFDLYSTASPILNFSLSRFQALGRLQSERSRAFATHLSSSLKNIARG